MKILLYGAGRKMEEFFGTCPFLEYLDIEGILDSDHNKWGQCYGKHKICSPDLILEEEWQKILVTPDSYEAICQELLQKYHLQQKDLMRPEELIVPAISNLGTISFNCKADEAYDIRDLVPECVITNNRLERFFFFEKHRLIWKWWHYFEIYHKYFKSYVGQSVKMLEIGVYKGGSVQMWKDYFGDTASIVGIDIDPTCKNYEEKGITICIGMQEDENFLKTVSKQYGPFDIILDDGGHNVKNQRKSFETLFPLLKETGLYLVEDIHSSYWPVFGGMPYGRESFIEYSKNFIDCLHTQHIDRQYLKLYPEYADYISACHFYDSMLVIEKKNRGRALTTTSETE